MEIKRTLFLICFLCILTAHSYAYSPIPNCNGANQALNGTSANQTFGCTSIGASGITLGTSSAATNPQRSSEAGTGLFSATSGTVSVASTGTDIVDIGANGLNIANGTLTGTSSMSNFLNVTGTLNATNTATANGAMFSITGNGSSSKQQNAVAINLNAGYTGSSSTHGLSVTNSSLGTGTAGITGGGANYGSSYIAAGVGTGNNVGSLGTASGSSSLNLGVSGLSNTSGGSSALNIGGSFLSLNATTNVGGFFGLMSTAPSPSGSAALIADNGTTSSPIFVAQNNGSPVVTIGSTGSVNAPSLILTTPLAITSGGTGTSSPSLVAGTNITISGSWPNQTINASGSGTVNSGTQYQMGYYASTGTAISGDASVLTDASNNFYVTSGKLGIGLSATPTNQISFTGQSAQEIWMERETTSSTNGNNLTIQAGGATSGGTNNTGGNLVLSSGISTGSAATNSNINFKAYFPGSSGTADNSSSTVLTIGPTSLSGGCAFCINGIPTPPSVSGGVSNTGYQIAITSGSGGPTTSTSSSVIGGTGGLLSFQGGSGAGASTGSSSNTGGIGGNFQFSAGTGGSPSGSSGTNTGGAGGSYQASGGPGASVFTLGTTNVGGAGGGLSFTGGGGGSAKNGSANTSGSGGALFFTSGAPGALGTGGANGTISFSIGSSGSTKAFISSGGLISLGSGTTAVSTTDIFGNLTIGASYAGVNAAPTNGLLVQGNAYIGTTSQLNSAILSVNGTVSDSISTLVDAAGTGLSKSAQTLNSNAVYFVSYQPGLLTGVSNTKGSFAVVGKASTVDNMTVSAITLGCLTNPTITLYECGTSTTCASPTTIASVQVTATGTATPATVSSSSITAGDYIAWSMSAGSCTSVDVQATAQIHSN